jgi:hypothetical protein
VIPGNSEQFFCQDSLQKSDRLEAKDSFSRKKLLFNLSGFGQILVSDKVA